MRRESYELMSFGVRKHSASKGAETREQGNLGKSTAFCITCWYDCNTVWKKSNPSQTNPNLKSIIKSQFCCEIEISVSGL